jgi:DNA-directed RNA polymerase specialized sigma24 family protein
MRNRDGDVSFEDFVRARSGSLLRTALLLVGQNRAEAEDLLQFALERAYRHWPRVCKSEPERNKTVSVRVRVPERYGSSLG